MYLIMEKEVRMEDKQEVKEIQYHERMRVVTDNAFIMAQDLPNLSTKARKLLYIAISQCKMTDKGFWEYYLSIKDFAKLMGIVPDKIYKEADDLTTEILKNDLIRVYSRKSRSWQKLHLFNLCEYSEDEKRIYFKIGADMTDSFLNLKNNFSKPLLSDFLPMKSRYSIAVWHLMQLKMNSKKPEPMDKPIKFYLTLDELRKVTGTEKKLKQISDFKNRVFDKAIREIKDCCGIIITYTNRKNGRKVIGFDCTAENEFSINLTAEEQERYSRNFKERHRIQ